MSENFLVILLVAYSITFGLQNDKISSVTDRLRTISIFDRMLNCSYCTGFHAGWLSWLLMGLLQGFPLEGWRNLLSLILTALAASMATYFLDSLVQAFERHQQKE